jgi:diguanylate cyclase (GGDEF)-like protein
VDAYAKAEKMRKTIENTEFVLRTNLTIVRATMSFGVACREYHNQTQDEIMDHADTALYQSKVSGRNRVYSYTVDFCPNFVRSLENISKTG